MTTVAISLVVGFLNAPANGQELRPAIPETEPAHVNPLPDEIIHPGQPSKSDIFQPQNAGSPQKVESPQKSESFRDKHGVVTDTAKVVGKGVESVGKGAVVGVESVGKGAGKVGKGAVVGVEKVGKGAVVGVETVGKGAGRVGKGAVVGVEKVGKGAVVGVEKLGKGLIHGIKNIGGGHQAPVNSGAVSQPAPQIQQPATQSQPLQQSPGWNQ